MGAGAVLWLMACATACANIDVTGERAALYADYSTQLAALAGECAAQQLPEAAAEVRAWLPQRAADQLTLFVIEPAGNVSKTGPGPGDDELPKWRQRWKTLRDAQADKLFALARRAVDERQPALVYELVTETVRENPDHKAARRMLGYVPYAGGWHTPFEVRQLSAGKVYHEQFGWLPKDHAQRYDAGERYYQGRWMPGAEETRLRGDMARGWRVESAHYTVTTNHSLEEGVRLSRQLERLYAVWQQTFISYGVDAAELKRRFAGRAARAAAAKHAVVQFRTREEYNAALRPMQPRIDITLGIYLDKARTAYFFAGDEQDPGTIHHEATHQLFQETRPVAPNVGRAHNFWVIEAIACYMESLVDHGATVTLGGADAGRMPAARHRLLVDKFYVPLAELVELGMESLQRDERLPRIYSQSAGLADFLMHDASGRYRQALVEYLLAVYSGRATPETLAELTGADYATLDRQYAAFMAEEVPADTAAAASQADEAANGAR